jgi:hypothetical protein
MTLRGLRDHVAGHAVLHNHKSAYHQSNLDGWWIGGDVVVLQCGLGLQLPSLSKPRILNRDAKIFGPSARTVN